MPKSFSEDHDVAAKALEALENAKGQLTPADVVIEASDPNSPLHDYFEWDDSVAAEQYRLDQARTLIRHIRVTVIVDERPIRTIKYIRDESAFEKESRYRNIVKVTEDDLIQRTLDTELTRIKGLIERGRMIAERYDRREEFDALLRQVVA